MKLFVIGDKRILTRIYVKGKLKELLKGKASLVMLREELKKFLWNASFEYRDPLGLQALGKDLIIVKLINYFFI